MVSLCCQCHTWLSVPALIRLLQIAESVPWKASSTSAMVGLGLFLSRAYMDMTMPGVQNPHWEPWAFAILSYDKHTQGLMAKKCRSTFLLPSRGQEKRFLLPSVGTFSAVFGVCFTCTGCSFLATLPMPSTVTTATRCSEQMGARQALTA